MKSQSTGMGCSFSKSEEGRGSSACYQFRIVHRKNDRAVVDNILLLLSIPKPLPEGGHAETHAKDVKKTNSKGEKGLKRKVLKRIKRPLIRKRRRMIALSFLGPQVSSYFTVPRLGTRKPHSSFLKL